MTLIIDKFVRKPLHVDAVRITEDNMVDVAKWCQGQIRDEMGRPLTEEQIQDAVPGAIKRHIYVRVPNPKNIRYTQGYPGDYIVFAERGGFKVYTEGAFNKAFDKVEVPAPEPTEPIPGVDELAALTGDEAREAAGLPPAKQD